MTKVKHTYHYRSLYSFLNVGLLFALVLLQASYTVPAQAQPFPSSGTRYGMNVTVPQYSELAYTDVCMEAWWGGDYSVGYTPYTANGYPTTAYNPNTSSSSYAFLTFCLTGDNPGTNLIYNFYGEGIFILAGVSGIFTNYDGYVPGTLSVLPPNYPGNPTNVSMTIPPNSPANPNSVPPTPANPFSIPLVIPANSPANPLSVVVTRCQYSFSITPQSTGGYNYGPPLNFIGVTNINPQQLPNEYMNNFHLIRPGYRAWQSSDSFYPVTNTSYPIFTKEFLSSFSPFCCLRFMPWMNTNNVTGLSWGTNGIVNSGPYTWAQRPPCNAGQYFGCGSCAGMVCGGCYENMIALANATGCDMWVNVPLQATDDWKVGFANMIANDPVYKLNPWLHVYYEHGNELWNWAFIAWQLVDQWAVSDFSSDRLGSWFNHGEEMGKLLMSDVNIMQPIFKQVSADFGRPILAGQFGDPQDYCGGGLYYIQHNYGTPSNYIYGLAGAPYFPTLDPSFITSNLQPSMNAYMQLISQYGGGLKMCCYEAGPSLPCSPESAFDIYEPLQSSPSMVTQYYNFANMWKNSGGDLCELFLNSGCDTQYGYWGHLPLGSLINDLSNPVCTKYNTAAGFNNLYGCNCGNAEPTPPPPPPAPPPPPPPPSNPTPPAPAPSSNSSSSKTSTPTSSDPGARYLGNGRWWSPKFGTYSTAKENDPRH